MCVCVCVCVCCFYKYVYLLKEAIFKEIKGNMMTLSQQTENLNRKIEAVKKERIK